MTGSMGHYLFQVLLAAAGGAVGSALRFALGGWVHRIVPFGTFPWGTLAVNVLGCLAIGLLAGLADFKQVLGPSQRVFLLIGVLGGFTTFSSFAFETFALAQDGQALRALANTAGQVLLGLSGAWIGYSSARFF